MSSLMAPHSRVIISCEGAAEEVCANILRAADSFIFPAGHVLKITRLRKAKDIQTEFLNLEYDWPVTILRFADSKSEHFELGNLYRGRYHVINALTRPEIEMLLIVNEDAYTDYSKRKTAMKPSEYCKQVLGFGRKVKSSGFWLEYWNETSLVAACKEYRRLACLKRGEVCVADLLK